MNQEEEDAVVRQLRQIRESLAALTAAVQTLAEMLAGPEQAGPAELIQLPRPDGGE